MNMFKGCLAAAVLSAGAIANAATIDFSAGNPPPGSEEVQIHFTGEFTGLLEEGFAGLTPVTFESQSASQIKTHPGGGVSFITGALDGVVDTPILFRLPFGLTFGDFSFNLQCGQGCAPVGDDETLTFAAKFEDGTTDSVVVPFGNGENRWTAIANGSQFTAVTFFTSTPYSHAEQFKVSELALAVPEPRTFGLMGLALIGLSILSSRKARA